MIPGLVVSAISLAVVFYFADLRRMLVALQLADYRLVAVSMALSIVWLVIRAAFWRTLLQNKPTFSQSFFTVNEGYLLNNILPFRLGEIGRAFLLSGKAQIGFWEVISSILVERILDVAAAGTLLLCTLPFVVAVPWAAQAVVAAGFLVVVGLGMLYLLARYRQQALALFDRLAARWPVLQKIGPQRLAAFFNGLAVLTDLGLFLRAIAWITLNWLVAILQYYILMLAFFPGGRLLWAVFSLGVVALGIAAPSSPGAVGVMELSMVAALSAFKLDASTALAFALSAHLINYLSTGVLGAYGLARDGETLSGLYSRVRKMPQNQAAG